MTPHPKEVSEDVKVALHQEPHVKLSELPATAICGNDISSSCLYVSALAILAAGQYAWVALLMVAAVLYLFRKIYGEVVGALPLNGGAYNALLNTTSKSTASMAACLTLLSYMATAVISANEAMHYVHILWEGLPVIPATIGLLALFMALTILGIGESSRVAVAIFLFHIATLSILVVVCVLYLFENGFDTLAANNRTPVEGGIRNALFFGFAAAMLGISGFESSANFVEEQKRGVFPKTLRNMWVVVSVYNPLITFLALALIPIAAVAGNQQALLSYLGRLAGGDWLAYLVSIDAVLVLSGAVLTSYVGVSGLVHRMTLDRCLPQFLLKLNKRGTTYRIMIAFFILCVSILLITKGELGALAGVYALSFLSVMALFALGNILLKFRRARLPRPERASGWAVLIALGAVLAALVGNALLNPQYVGVFMQYLIPTIAVVGIMLFRIPILKFILYLNRSLPRPFNQILKSVPIRRAILQINSQQFVYFTKGHNVIDLNKVMLYILRNEDTHRIKIVTVVKDEAEVPKNLPTDIEVLDRAYPSFEVDFVVLKGEFGPKLIEELSLEWNIPKNFMFIASPGDRFPYRVSELGGVRLII